jgi:hypothetical protein
MRWSGISDQLRMIRMRWACPNEARLAAFVDQAAGSADEAPIMRHLARCEDCRSQVGFLARMQRPAPEMEVPAAWLGRVKAITASEGKAWRMRRWVPVALVAAAAILIAAMLLRPPSPVSQRPAQATTPTSQPQVAASAAPAPKLFTKGKQRDREVFRNSNTAVSLRITNPAQGSRIAPGSSIRWQSIENSMYYEAQLLSADGELLWKAKVEAPQTALPADIAVPAERKCFLIVRAYLPDGKTVESDAVRVVLQPRS